MSTQNRPTPRRAPQPKSNNIPVSTNKTQVAGTTPTYSNINDIPVPNFGINASAKVFSDESPYVEQTVEKQEPSYPKNFVDNVISINSIKSILDASNSSGFYDIYFPSIDKTYTFKQLKVGQQRSISKNSADFENKTAQVKLRLSILKSICLDESFDPMQITWPEFVSALIKVRINNFLDPLTYNIKCNNEKCKIKFKYDVSLDESVENIDKIIQETINTKNKEFKFKMNDIEIKFDLDFISMEKYFSILNYIDERNNELEEINTDELSVFTYSYIKDIYINNVKVDIESIRLDPKEFTKFIEDTFSFNYNSFIVEINKYFEKFSLAISRLIVKCPKCKQEQTLILDIEDFFEQ